MKYALYDRRERMLVIWEIDFYCLIRLRYIHIASLQTVGSEKPNSEKSRKLNFIIMCFGNGKKQGDCFPKHNNYCGGFALNAVLRDLDISKEKPIDTYGEIRTVQANKMVNPSNSAIYVRESEQKSKTAMLLPSSIALYAKTKKLDAMVLYNPSIKDTFEGILKEEEGKLDSMAEKVAEDFWTKIDSSKFTYFIVLVNNRHWVAVKRMDGNDFICYNPGDGSCTTEAESSIEGAIKRSYKDNTKEVPTINPLVIALSK